MKKGISFIYILREDHERIRQASDIRSVIGLVTFDDGKLYSMAEDVNSVLFSLSQTLVGYREQSERLAKKLNKPFNEFAIHLPHGAPVPRALSDRSFLALNAAIDNNDWYQLERAV